ncbi:anthrone oxygenase family protein [Plantactinospora sp. DSM 117369]
MAPAPRRTTQLARAWSLGGAVVAMGLIAGFFYAYACSVMIGLARVDDHTFISTMQWINATVRNGWFAASFFGALPLTAIAAILHLRRDGRPVLPWIVAAFLLYVVAFAITMGISVPLNEELAAAGDPSAIGDPAAVRAAYEGSWVNWNIARAVAATAALGCLVRALIVHARLFPARPTQR